VKQTNEEESKEKIEGWKRGNKRKNEKINEHR
jgi:hypothetical protein